MSANAKVAAHTPGPWIPTNIPGLLGGADVIVSLVREDAIVCSMGHDMPEILANARLIAAAPELAESLREILTGQLHGNIDTEAPRFQKARAALAKAGL